MPFITCLQPWGFSVFKCNQQEGTHLLQGRLLLFLHFFMSSFFIILSQNLSPFAFHPMIIVLSSGATTRTCLVPFQQDSSSNTWRQQSWTSLHPWVFFDWPKYCQSFPTIFHKTDFWAVSSVVSQTKQITDCRRNIVFFPSSRRCYTSQSTIFKKSHDWHLLN